MLTHMHITRTRASANFRTRSHTHKIATSMLVFQIVALVRLHPRTHRHKHANTSVLTRTRTRTSESTHAHSHTRKIAAQVRFFNHTYLQIYCLCFIDIVIIIVGNPKGLISSHHEKLLMIDAECAPNTVVCTGVCYEYDFFSY